MILPKRNSYDFWDVSPESEWMVSIAQIQSVGEMPSARTYHASTVVQDTMFVIGGEADSDLNDLWAFNFQRY